MALRIDDPIVEEIKLDNGLIASVLRTIMGNGRLCVTENPAHGYSQAWCYPSVPIAREALQDWDVLSSPNRPPDGWTRELHTGLRRPDGTPESEVLRP